MPHSFVPSVKSLGVNPVELAHAQRKIRLWGLHQQVIVVIHQAVGITEPAVASDNVGESANKQLSICIVQEHFLASIAPGGKMIDSPRILQPKGTRHALSLSE
jgi:hypothetical protein